MEEAAFLQVSIKFWKKGVGLQLAQGAPLEALELCGMIRNLRLLTSSTAHAGSSPAEAKRHQYFGKNFQHLCS